MKKKKYVVKLTKDQREYLHKLISAGTAPARMLNRARILLKADVGEHAGGGAQALIDEEIAKMLWRPPRLRYSACGSVFVGRASWMRRSNVLCQIGCISALSMGAPKLA